VLDRRAVHLRADFRQHCIPVFPLDVVELDLDEFMRLEAAVDFLQDRCREAFAGDADDGIKMVSGGAQGSALLGSKFDHGGILTR